MIRTRPFAYADLPVLHRMICDLARHHGDTPSITREALLRDITGSAPRARVLVAETGGTLAGYAALVPLIQLQWGRRVIDLHNLWVEPDWRRRGVGKALIDAAIEAARADEATVLNVGTHPDNSAAQAYYLALGFSQRPSRGPRFRLAL